MKETTGSLPVQIGFAKGCVRRQRHAKQGGVMEFIPGPMELVIILIIVAMLFGVGRLPEVFGAVGKGLREFRREMSSTPEPTQAAAQQPVEKAIAEPVAGFDTTTPTTVNQSAGEAVTQET